MTTSDMAELVEFKDRMRATWAAGDYDEVSEPLWSAGAELVRRIGVQPGEAVLDVACGTGNAAVQAAREGGQVVGADLTPELFPAARERAAAAGVEIDWREGDAEALPFDDDSFDVVLSTFGVMFAPRHAVAASELARVLRPGGRLGLCHWTPQGSIGALFGTVAAHLPDPPPFVQRPLLWGEPEHVRSLFAGTSIEFAFDRGFVDFHFDTIAEGVEFYTTKFGPIIKARALLEPEGRWPALVDDLTRYLENTNLADPGVHSVGEYLLAVGTKHV